MAPGTPRNLPWEAVSPKCEGFLLARSCPTAACAEVSAEMRATQPGGHWALGVRLPGPQGLRPCDPPGLGGSNGPVVGTQVGLDAPGPEGVWSLPPRWAFSRRASAAPGSPHPRELRDPSAGVAAPILSLDLPEAATTEVFKCTPCPSNPLSAVQDCPRSVQEARDVGAWWAQQGPSSVCLSPHPGDISLCPVICSVPARSGGPTSRPLPPCAC